MVRTLHSKVEIMQADIEYATVVIPLAERDVIYMGELTHFWQEVSARLPGIAVIFVNEDGIPLIPLIAPSDIPHDAIWLTKFKF